MSGRGNLKCAYVRFSNRVSLSSSVFPVFVVITALVTLLYVVGLAECRAATSIGRNGLESLALEGVANVRFGSIPLKNSFLQVDWKIPTPWPNFPKIELGGQSLPRYFAV